MVDPTTFDPFATGASSPAAGTIDYSGAGSTRGYGAAPAAEAAPSSFADEVRARAAKIQYTGRGAATATPAAAETLTASRFAAPAWLKTAGGFGAKLAKGPVGLAVTGASILGPMIEPAFEKLGDMNQAGPGAAAVADSPGGLPITAPAPAPSFGAMPDGVDQATMGQNNLRAVGVQSVANRAQPDNLTAPAPGTGFIRNDQTGRTTYLNNQTGGFGANAQSATNDYANRGLIGGLITSQGAISQANTERRQANENTKLAIAGATAGAAGSEHMANAQKQQLINAMTLKLLDPNVSDTAKEQIRSSLVSMHGRAAAGQYTVPMNAMPTAAGAMPVLNRGTGEMEMKTPKAPMVEGQRYHDGKGGTYTYKNGQKVPDK